MIQGNLNEVMVQSALTVIPTVVTMVDSGVKAFSNLHGAVNLVNKATAFLAANPLMAVVMAIGLVVGALITAYQTCEPFRNAVNAIGSAIYNFFKPAIDAVVGALTWLWQNVVQPFIAVLKTLWDTITGNPILAALFGPITTIAYLIQHWSDVTKALGDVWNAMCSGISWAWNTFIKPIVDAVKWFCDTVYGAFKTLFSWLVGGSVWADLCKGIVGLWNTVVAPLVNTVKGFCNAITGFFQGLAGAVGNVWNGIVNTVSGAVNTIKNAVGGIASAIGNAVSSAGNSLNNFASNVGNAMSGAWNSISNFIGSVCFAHAIGNAVESSRKSLTQFTDTVEEAMTSAYGSIKSFGAELKAPALGPTPAAVGSTAAGSQTLVLAPTFNFPEGSLNTQDPREFAEAVYNELSAIVRRDLRAQTFFVAR
jgi:phage-related protein